MFKMFKTSDGLLQVCVVPPKARTNMKRAVGALVAAVIAAFVPTLAYASCQNIANATVPLGMGRRAIFLHPTNGSTRFKAHGKIFMTGGGGETFGPTSTPPGSGGFQTSGGGELNVGGMRTVGY